MHIQTDGLVLREADYKEGSKMLTLLTRSHGRLSVLARGVRKNNSPLMAAAQFLVYSDMTLFVHKGRYVLDEAEVRETFHVLRSHLPSLSLAAYISELASGIMGEVADEGLLDLLLRALYNLSPPEKPLALIKTASEWRMMALAGFAPVVSHCAHCHAQAPVKPYFLPLHGQVVCGDCREEAGAIFLGEDAWLALRYILSCPARRLFSFSLEKEAMSRLSQAGEAYIATQLERKFATLDFYHKISV